MIKLPNPTWNQPNLSDKSGNVWYTRNINFDEQGYMKLSPRTVKLIDDNDNADFGFPHTVGVSSSGEFQVATGGDNFSVDLGSGISTTEDSGTANPTMAVDSSAVWYKGLWHVSTDTAVLSKASVVSNATWTSRITGLTSGKNHALEVFSSRQSLCVANGNVVKQYDTSYASTIDLTIPSDFEITGLSYNTARMAVATKLSNDGTDGQDQEARLFIWDGSSTGASTDAGVGSDAIMGICAYKSSFAVLVRTGELLVWNGGGLTKIGQLPVWVTENYWSSPTALNHLGTIPMVAQGDVIYINIDQSVSRYSDNFTSLANMPGGVWCYDPEVGLYHRYSPSNSKVDGESLAGTTVNTSTDTITTNAVTVPRTGGVFRLTLDQAGIGGLEVDTDYYIIKVDANNLKLATTKENAELGIAIDITSVTTTGNAFIYHVYDLTDYGQAYYSSPGAIGLTYFNTGEFKDIIVGGRFLGLDGSNIDAVCVAVPNLENRGYYVSPKIYPQQQEDIIQKLYIKFRPLGTDDKIIVKYRKKDVYNLPTISNALATWTGKDGLYTTQDLSVAKTYLGAGGELELELTSGAGAGTLVKITAINEDSGTYSLELAEDVLGAVAGRKSNFVIWNWQHLRTITSDDESAVDVAVGEASNWYQFKIELRGVETTIEELQIVNQTHKQI